MLITDVITPIVLWFMLHNLNNITTYSYIVKIVLHKSQTSEGNNIRDQHASKKVN